MYGQEKRMIDDIKKHREGMAVWWAGHNSWIIKSGDLVVATDLYLENDTRIFRRPSRPRNWLRKLTFHLLRMRTAIILMSTLPGYYLKSPLASLCFPKVVLQ